MSVYSIAPLIGSLSALFLALFVFLKNKRSETNISFALFALTVFTYLFAYAIAYSIKSEKIAVELCKVSCTAVIFTASTCYHFIVSFLNAEKDKKFVAISYIITFIMFYFFVDTKYFLNGVYKYYWGYYSKAGFLHPLFLIFLFSNFGRGFLLLFKEMRKGKEIGETRYYQVRHVFFAFVMALTASIDFVPKYNIEIYPFGFVFMVTFVAISAYAIVRHQLMEIEVIIKKTIVFAGLFAAALAVFVLPTLIIQELIVAQMGIGARIAGLSISAILVILILRPLENFLIKITDRFLFQKKYDYKELLKTFSTEVLTVLDKDVLVHTTVDRLSNIMKIQSCGILLLNKEKNQYELVSSVGVDRDWRSISLSLDNTLASFLNRTKSYLSAKHQGKDSPMPKRIIDDMNKLKLELAIPLFIHDDMIGILTLGKKKSDEDYTQDDMDILLPLARTLAIAISNATALDELGKTQAEAAQREKMAVIGTLSAGINHEICNPLGIARGQCEAFLLNIKDGLYKKKSDKELLEKAQQIMEKVIHETDRATIITKRLSSFAKPSKGLMTDDIGIKDEIDEVLALVGYEMKLDKIEVINEVSENLSHIIGDKKQLQEVFFNLIRNAAQAIHEKGKITVKAHEDTGRVYIEIEDTGHGIPEDKLDQIFNPFYTTKEPGKGTGLGLFIVRQVIERNKGRISVKSKVGEGTTFTLEFPAAEKVRV